MASLTHSSVHAPNVTLTFFSLRSPVSLDLLPAMDSDDPSSFPEPSMVSSLLFPSSFSDSSPPLSPECLCFSGLSSMLSLGAQPPRSLSTPTLMPSTGLSAVLQASNPKACWPFYFDILEALQTHCVHDKVQPLPSQECFFFMVSV